MFSDRWGNWPALFAEYLLHCRIETGVQPFDAVEFPFLFLAAFGNKQSTVKRLRKGESNASNVPGGMEES